MNNHVLLTDILKGGGCSASGYYDKASCENAGYSYSVITGRPTTGTCSAGDVYTNEASCTSAGYYTDGGCSDSTYSDKYSCENAGYYQYEGSCSNPFYTDQYTCESENFSWSGSGTFMSSGNTWSEPAFVSYGYTWNQPWYEEFTDVTIPYGYTWKEPQWVNAGYSWTYSSYAPYGYRWIEASERETKESVEASIENLSKEYTDKLKLRSEQMQEISSKESNLSSLYADLKDLAGKKISIKENIVKLESRIRDIESRASKGLCQAFEVSCSDSLDNDNDTKIDCSDSDCTYDTYCSKTTTNPGTSSSTDPGSTSTNPVITKPISSKPLFSSKFNGTFSTVVSLTNNVLTVNSKDIVPAMKDLRVQASSSSTNPQALLSRISTVKAMVNSNIDTIAKLKTALTQLQTENVQTEDTVLKIETTKLVSAGNLLVDSLNAYHATLLKFLTGTVPTPDLDVELNQRIADATVKGNSYRSLVTSTNTALVAAIKKAEANALTQSNSSSGTIKASAITPRPGEVDVSVSLDKITVTFAQDVVAFNKATVVVKDSFGDTLGTVEMMGAKNTFVVELTDPLKNNNIYTVSISGVFIQETTLSEQTWSQTWSFGTEKKEGSIIDTIIDIIDDLFGLGNNKGAGETVCDDGKDNDNNGVADCSDKACEDSAVCKNKAECGNSKVEEGEECDDGNNIAGDGCTGCQKDKEGDGNCIDNDGDGYDDSDTSRKCGCIDKDSDNKDDIDGSSCSGGDSQGKTCLLCEYDSNEQRFRDLCENSYSADKKIIETDIDGSEAAECPQDTTHYKFVIESHSCSVQYGKMSNKLKSSLPVIRTNIDRLEVTKRRGFESRNLTISGNDTGCHSAGGVFSKGNPWYNAFDSVLKKTQDLYFKNAVNVIITGNQTYGWTRTKGGITKDITTDGRVQLRASVAGRESDLLGGEPKKGEVGNISIQLAECPTEGSFCSAPVNNPYLIQERIVCGEESKPRNFYCTIGYVDERVPGAGYDDGKWVEEK